MVANFRQISYLANNERTIIVFLSAPATSLKQISIYLDIPNQKIEMFFIKHIAIIVLRTLSFQKSVKNNNRSWRIQIVLQRFVLF